MRWSERYRLALRPRDTMDTVDTVAPAPLTAAQSVLTVQSVLRGCVSSGDGALAAMRGAMAERAEALDGIMAAPDVLDDREAIRTVDGA